MNREGIVRKIDNLGRIVIPKEYRKQLNISDQDEIEITLEEDNIIIRKVKCNINYRIIIKEIMKEKGYENYSITQKDIELLIKEIDMFLEKNIYNK